MEDKNREIVFEMYKGLCILCSDSASCVHEIIPRSKTPNDWDVISNRVSLCSKCHTAVHANPPAFADKLRRQADYLLQALNDDSGVE